MSTAVGEVLAAASVAAFGADAARVIARIGGRDGRAAAARLVELGAMSDADGRRARATWAAESRTAVPAGLRGVHASWIEAALVGEPAGARGAVASGGRDPVHVWLARRVCARFPASPAPRAQWPVTVDDVVACAGETLAAWLAAVGADQLALAFGAAGREAIDGAVAARIAVAPRVGALGPPRAAVERCSGVRLEDPATLVRIGARAVAPHLGGRPIARALVLRLPRAIGLVVAGELRAHAADPIERAPMWAAIIAPV